MSYIIYPQDSGQIAVVIPADETLTIDQIIQKDVPSSKPYVIVDDLSIIDRGGFEPVFEQKRSFQQFLRQMASS